MRLAIVAASTYEENGQVAPIPNAELDVELFGARLAEPDAGFVVHAFSAQPGLAEGMEELVLGFGTKPKALIFYFWGYALVSEERGPTLLLDGPKLSTLTLARLRRQLTDLAETALVVLDLTLAAGSHGDPLSAVRAMGSALSNSTSPITTLLAVRSSAAPVPQGPPPFTGLLQMILDAQTGQASALTPELLFRAMQAEEVMFADIPAAGCFLGRSEFTLVAGAAPSRAAPAPALYDDTDEVTAPRLKLSAAAVHESSELAPARPVATYPPPPPPLPRPSASRSPARPSALPPALERPASSAAAHCRQLLSECEAASDRDGAYRAALCLAALGEANDEEAQLVALYRAEGLPPFQRALSDDDWIERLCVGCREPRTSAILSALGPALGRVGYQRARRLRRQPSLIDDSRQDLEQSTTMLAKSLLWASRFLCVPQSELYVLGEVPGTLELVPGPERPVMTCARSLGRGKSVPELVCLFSRELAFARPEQAALCYFPGPSELSELLLAALAVGDALELRVLDDDQKRLASLLKREVRGPALEALRAAARAFPVSQLVSLAASFVRSAELVASRVSFLACGDLELTLALDHSVARRWLTDAEERRADLLRFTVSRELGELRGALGVRL